MKSTEEMQIVNADLQTEKKTTTYWVKYYLFFTPATHENYATIITPTLIK